MSQDDWDFYPCRIDDVPASFFINLRYLRETPKPSNDHVHMIRIAMRALGEHGLGVGEEIARLGPVEDALFERAQLAGAEPIGHIRSAGIWEIWAYGPKDLPWARWLEEHEDIDATMLSHQDATFSELKEFLLPDEERHQWILNRRVCDVLEEQGDDPPSERPVDHSLDIDGSASPELLFALQAGGFEVHPHPRGLRLVKSHSTELSEVHDIVMELRELAEQHMAVYAGWGCPVVRVSN